MLDLLKGLAHLHRCISVQRTWIRDSLGDRRQSLSYGGTRNGNHLTRRHWAAKGGVAAILLPSKLLQLFLGADEFYCAIVEQDQTSLEVVVVEGEQLGSTTLIPAGFRFE